MKTKYAVVLLAAALAASAALVYATRAADPAAESPAGGRTADAGVHSPAPSAKVIAYYFHVTARCATCRTIEDYSREAVERGFADQIKGGAVVWRPVNVQLSENRRFISEYKLFTRSLIIARMKDGKQVEWRNLEKVWDLVGNKSEFTKYVQAQVQGYLGGR